MYAKHAASSLSSLHIVSYTFNLKENILPRIFSLIERTVFLLNHSTDDRKFSLRLFSFFKVKRMERMKKYRSSNISV